MNTVDQLIHGFDGLLRTVARVKPEAQNRSPADGALDEPLTADEKNSREILCALTTLVKFALKGYITAKQYLLQIRLPIKRLSSQRRKNWITYLGAGTASMIWERIQVSWILYGMQHLSVSGQGRP